MKRLGDNPNVVTQEFGRWRRASDEMINCTGVINGLATEIGEKLAVAIMDDFEAFGRFRGGSACRRDRL